MNTSASLSIILPVYNAASFLAESLSSILNQTFKNYEIVVVDDGSTDNSPHILRKFASESKNIKIISRPNTGIVGALNDGIAAAKAPLLARMDADDIAHSTRFEKQVAFLAEHPEVVALGSWVNMVWVDGSPIYEYKTPTEHEEIKRQLLDGNGGAIIHPSAIFRREAVHAVGGYRQEALWFEDLDLYLRLLDQGKLANLPETLLDYRQHLKSVNQSAKAATLRAEKRLGILNQHRQRCGLTAREGPRASQPSMAQTKFQDAPANTSLQQWIGLARSSGNIETARKLARLLTLRQPLSKRSWQLLRYTYS